MNYRHAYHAGNFADVLKHLVFVLVIEYLKHKDAAFRVIDTHAGPGRYLLNAPQAVKTGEWSSGIGRLLGPDAPSLPSQVAGILARYLDVVRAENSGQRVEVYPGSPLIARRLLRRQDFLVANELHPEDGTELKVLLGRDRRAKVLALDGWMTLRSLLPPKERRGVVLIDPPFEEEGELARMAAGLGEALRRFKSGIYICWYPIKDIKPVASFHKKLAAMEAGMLRVEIMLRAPADPLRLNGCGLVIANPPFTLHDRLAVVLPVLKDLLADGPGADYRLDRITQPERLEPEGAVRSQRSKPGKTQKAER